MKSESAAALAACIPVTTPAGKRRTAASSVPDFKNQNLALSGRAPRGGRSAVINGGPAVFSRAESGGQNFTRAWSLPGWEEDRRQP